MRSLQCNVQFGYQLSILLWDQAKPWKTLIELAGRRTFWMQSGIKYSSPNTSAYLCFFLSYPPPLSFLFENIYKLFFQNFYRYVIWISTKLYITLVEGMNAFRHKYAYNYIP
jgi:hypothetical protein